MFLQLTLFSVQYILHNNIFHVCAYVYLGVCACMCVPVRGYEHARVCVCVCVCESRAHNNGSTQDIFWNFR